jgi:hypothetical protein
MEEMQNRFGRFVLTVFLQTFDLPMTTSGNNRAG